MIQLICHLLGDYVLQNHWMANNKTSSTLACAVHVALYSLPFALLIGVGGVGSWWSLAVIAGTHFVIDRWRLAKLWVNFWGVGVPSSWMARLEIEQPPAAPSWMGVWLLIIVDNTIHLAINAGALTWL